MSTENNNNSIKNIIYLDYEKMYSLSAQLFKGVIFESLIEKGYSFSEKDSIKSFENNNTENDSRKNYVKPYDYHYSMFESKLYELDKITTLSKGAFHEKISLTKIKNHPFIKSTGVILITDPVALTKLTKDFNRFNDHLGYITNAGEINALYSTLKELTKNNKQKIADIRSKIKSLEDELAYIRTCSNQKYHDSLAEILEFSYGTEIEINQNMGEYIISGFFEREFLKQSVSTILKRYSRKTVTEFTILGIPTQFKTDEWTIPDVGFNDFRGAIKALNQANYNVEKSFLDVADKELILEPIAMYTEL